MKSNVHDIFIAAYWCEIYINITTRPCRFDRYGDGIEIIVTNDTLRRIYYLDEDVILVETPLTGESRLYYAQTDRLGSYTDIMNGEGNRVFEADYDAWGRQTVSRNTIGFIRGYTGHEMLPEFGLINMNGRMYDPLLARFLSPDDFIQMPFSPQSYNRYSYCLNNPLKYTDPSGEFWHLIIGAAAGGVINWLTHGCEFNMKGLGYFGVGALSGALAAGVGAGIASALPVSGATAGGFAAGFWGTSSATVATSSFWSGAAIGGGAGLVSGFTTGFGNGLIEGNGFGNAFGAGSFEGLLGGVSGGLIGGILGGITAERNGRNFWNGSKFISEKTIVDLNMPHVSSRGSHNCVYASLESVDKSYGGDITQEYLRSIGGGDPNIDGVEVAKALNQYNQLSKGYTKVVTQGSKQDKLNGIKNSLLNKNRVLLNKPAKIGSEGHMVVMNSIIERSYRTIRGRELIKILYYVMDPAKNALQRISTSDINSSDIIFYWR